MKQGLVLDRVVLLGRTFEEYVRCFDLNREYLDGKEILDVASGVSSFAAEASDRTIHVTAFDVIYGLEADEIQRRCEPDLESVVSAVRNLPVYRWDFYTSPEHMREYREKAYKRFLLDYRMHRSERYVSGNLPVLPFRNNQFDLTVVSYLLFVYEDQLDFEFHKKTILEIMRVTSGEARIYPLVTFEATLSVYLSRLMEDPELRHFQFERRTTDFEFLRNSNQVLVIRRKRNALQC